ncbi:hypothetical protein AX16_008809 [Volvariella volvacea WC 439]|nr:hypothetical protein AX16_008809 [Volvariella volvacea WC 439]
METDSTFVAPEGVYSVVDEHKPTVLQTTAATLGPINFPTRVSTVVVRYPATKQGGGPGFAQLLGGGGGSKDKDAKKDKATKDREDGASLSSSTNTPDEGDLQGQSTQENVPTSPGIPHDQPTWFSGSPPHLAPGGRKKAVARPKHNLRGTSSTFITRVQLVEGLAKLLQSKQGDVTFAFYNLGKTFFWLEPGPKSKEPLGRIGFSAWPTCHDVNATTASHDHLDVIIGFNTGDLIWLDPISLRYVRLNKGGCISSSPVTSVRWVPSSATLFLVSHADGTIIAYDKERDDGTFTPQEPVAPTPDTTTSTSESSSQKEWDPTDNIFITMPPWHPAVSSGGNGTANNTGKSDKDKAKNPVSHWRVSKRSVVDFVFSPDVKYVGAISEDGCLRVIDALAEQLVDCYASYFGALTCVAWSPDGRFIVTGGQDDLLTIISPWEQRIIARCQGHSSFVSSVAFDESRCDGRTYRFGSVGEDNKLILWDFSSGALHRPKFQAHHQRVSMSSTISLAFRRDRSAPYLPSSTSVGLDGGNSLRSPRYHPALSRNEVAVVQPVLIKQLEGELLTVIAFLPRSILTSTKNGHIKFWVRPLAHKSKTQLPKNFARTPVIDI